MSASFSVVMPIYDGVDLLDVTGPREVFSWLPSLEPPVEVSLVLAASSLSPVTTRDGLRMLPDKTFDEVETADLLWTPGGDVDPLWERMHDPVYLDFLRRISARAQWTASVCEGAMLLAAAGLLDGHEATTHWAFKTCLAAYPRVTIAPGLPRFVVCGRLITGGGISSGLDEALEVVCRIWGQAAAETIQQVTQYFPDPPVQAPQPTPGACPLPSSPPPGR